MCIEKNSRKLHMNVAFFFFFFWIKFKIKVPGPVLLKPFLFCMFVCLPNNVQTVLTVALLAVYVFPNDKAPSH